MKKLLISALVLFSLQGKAQLDGTKWSGVFLIPEPAPCILSFEKDTMKLFLQDATAPLEVSTYNIKGEVLYIKKVDGSSPCDTTVTGSYYFKIDSGKLHIDVIDDQCPPRVYAFPKQPLEKVDAANETSFLDIYRNRYDERVLRYFGTTVSSFRMRNLLMLMQ